MAQTAADHARRALHLNGGNERTAVEFLVQMFVANPKVLEAFFPLPELEKRARRVVHKVKREAAIG